jgi:hypothetical protein
MKCAVKHEKYKSFLVQQFLENAAEVKGTLVEYALTGATHPPSWEGQSAKRPCINKKEGGVDDPAARWSSTLSRALPTLPSGRVSQQNALANEAVGGVDDPTARWWGRRSSGTLVA